MKEYIEREAILQHKRKMRGFDLSEEFWDKAVLCEDIQNIPAADVVPVVHGEWIAKIHNDGLGNYTLYHCSECDCKNAYKRNYCGNCGAKMDGGK